MLRYEEERVGSRILTVFLILSTSLPHSTLAVYLRPPRHLAETLLQQGSDSWNQWRSQSPAVQPDLEGATLSGVELSGANLSEVNLTNALLGEARLQGATFWQATLKGCDLHRADLRQAQFYHADLRQANLSESNLDQANLGEALLDGTNFANVDLRTVTGLETARHAGRSYVDIHTLYRSEGQIPEIFLRGIGAPEHLINYTTSLHTTPVQYSSCFISSSRQDAAFVSRLYTDLQSHGVRCWSLFHDPTNENIDLRHIKETLQMHDAWLLVLSEHTLINGWVGQEMQVTMNLEQWQNRTILFPLCLAQTFLDLASNRVSSLLQNRQMRNFVAWQDTTAYQQAFTELLQELKKVS